MGFIYGLAAVLLVFEGIIIQCEGGCIISSHQKEDVTDNDNKENLPSLPGDLIEIIVDQIGIEKKEEILRDGIKFKPNPLMSSILPNCIIFIDTKKIDGRGFEVYIEHDDLFVRFGSDQNLAVFFKKYGEDVRKIHINLCVLTHEPGILNIFKVFAKNLVELRSINSHDNGKFWDALSNGENGIIFPKVKKLHIEGEIKRNEFKFDLIFPKLESLSLNGNIVDKNCLANVKGLNELTLDTTSIPEDKLDHIFANNKNMTMIDLYGPKTVKTMQLIAYHLNDLKTLRIRQPGRNFLLRGDNDICVLPSVKSFHIVSDERNELNTIGNPSFDMPELQKLTCYEAVGDFLFVEFIRHFKKLEKMELLLRQTNIHLILPVDSVWRLSGIKTDRIGRRYLELIRSR